MLVSLLLEQIRIQIKIIKSAALHWRVKRTVLNDIITYERQVYQSLHHAGRVVLTNLPTARIKKMRDLSFLAMFAHAL